ncbi:SDR family NAD(P)-dependent oxidoreductase [Lunatibacter salilacus]|uniref:SDR family NAD(P)-dependent oxidoreductase n=1 Tax=Lunatibacter salilacus TaxID=2483804 RepID=UPI00131A7038|nr:SDR family NAD(P)-dependent oxidoreductase [Lunatibacter salilacus]
MEVFLTGGTGFIGQLLTQALVQRGWEVIALVRKPDSNEAKSIQAMGATLIQGDITDLESMREGMSGTDAVIHNAAWYEFGVSKSARDKMQAINVQGTENTLRLAVELGIQKIVYTSTILAFGDTGDVVADERFQRRVPPQSSYEKTKTEAHEFAKKLQQDGAPVVIACPAGVIGPGDHTGLGYMARMYVRGLLPPVLFAANGLRAHVHVDDVVEGIVGCVEHGQSGETYILSNGIMQHRDMFDLWKQTPGGFKTTLFWMPKPMAMLFNRVCEPIERVLGLPIVFGQEFALAAFSSFQFSAAKAERELGIRFRSVEQAWIDTLEAERTISRYRKS